MSTAPTESPSTDQAARRLLATYLRETDSGQRIYWRDQPQDSAAGRAILDARSLELRELLGRLEPRPSREGLIGAFCALLELVRLGLVTARQEHLGDEIEVALRDDAQGDFEALIEVTRFMDEEAAAGEDPPEAAPAAHEGPARASAEAPGA